MNTPSANDAPAHRGVRLSTAAFTVLLAFVILPWVLVAAGRVKGMPKTPATAEKSEPAGHGGLIQTGRWGRLEITRITIMPPEELIPVDWYKHLETQWLFMGYSSAEVQSYFEALDLPASVYNALRNEAKWMEVDGGVMVIPNDATILELPAQARAKIYDRLNILNAANGIIPTWSVPTAIFEDVLADSHLEETTKAMVRKLSYQRGSRTYVPDSFVVSNAIKDPSEKLNAVRLFYSAQTMLVKLRIDRNSNVDEIAEYWKSRGGRKDLKPILESVADLPNGGTVDIAHLLPSFARQRIYIYPHPDLMNDGVNRDCHWTSLNFYSITPDNGMGVPEQAQAMINDAYHLVGGEPKYGDLIFMSTPDGNIIHSAVYLAGTLVFTKNGPDLRSPYIIMQLDELLNIYKPSDDIEVRVQYWRYND